ncbi:hypothetical protein SLEP1_g60163 [Rubroshorea leprosula]|uniref:Uncharacterized protein n=1 Tax=Rubroshorea leprosula TaxID=152421 RepID=A0AAV5MUI0_9ROSI|nr:hypothetical protein SLEP1_g60163 [Rubroshorea leprosula]
MPSLKKTEQKQQNLLRLRQANPKIYQWDYRVQCLGRRAAKQTDQNGDKSLKRSLQDSEWLI